MLLVLARNNSAYIVILHPDLRAYDATSERLQHSLLIASYIVTFSPSLAHSLLKQQASYYA
jgi:hypothetical protein